MMELANRAFAQAPTATAATVSATAVCGLAVPAVARLAGLSSALVTCGVLFAITIVLIRRASVGSRG
jgi:hypothetical protein